MLQKAIIEVLRSSMIELKMEQELTLFDALVADLMGGGLDVVEVEPDGKLTPPEEISGINGFQRRDDQERAAPSICADCSMPSDRLVVHPECAHPYIAPYWICLDCMRLRHKLANPPKQDSVSNPTPQPVEGVEIETESSPAAHSKFLRADKPTPSESRMAWTYQFGPEAAVSIIRILVDRDSTSEATMKEIAFEMALPLDEIRRLATNTHRLRLDLLSVRGVERDEMFDKILARWKARPVAA